MIVKFSEFHPAMTAGHITTGRAIAVRGLHVVVQVASSNQSAEARLVPATSIIPEAATPEGVEPQSDGYPSFPEIYKHFTGEEIDLKGPNGGLSMAFTTRE